MIPVGDQGETQFIYIIDKDKEGKIKYSATLSVVIYFVIQLYVPLTSKEEQLNKY